MRQATVHATVYLLYIVFSFPRPPAERVGLIILGQIVLIAIISSSLSMLMRKKKLNFEDIALCIIGI